jgi:hypothetical protein
MSSAPDSYDLPYSPKPETQERGYWCWAASSKLVFNAIRPQTVNQQCDVVNTQTGMTTCCTTAQCNFHGMPPYLQYKFSKHDQNLLQWDDIRDQLGRQKKPVTFIWQRKDLTQHMGVVVGYHTGEQGVAYVTVNDPEPGKGLTVMTYQSYYGGDLMTHDQQLILNEYDITYTGP